jgi:hypothetical protein
MQIVSRLLQVLLPDRAEEKKHRGANKQIRSQSYRDRFQMDLIDFLKQASCDFED